MSSSPAPSCPLSGSVPEPLDSSSPRDFFSLLKPGVMMLVVFTGAIGLFLAPVSLHPYLSFITILSIALGSGGAAAINMWFDADIDKIMRRTQRRPVPAGRLDPESALQFGLLLSVLAVSLLYLATNALAAELLAFSIFFYSVVYTMWLKRTTPQNIVIGGAAGAFPPVIGWTAATGSISLPILSLFLIIFLWTPPHFWALALYRSEEYAKAKVPMLPVTAGIQTTKNHILGYSCLLCGSTLLPWFLGLVGNVYALGVIMLNAYFLGLSLVVKRSMRPRFAYHLFGYSIFYLFLLFTLLLLDKR